MRLAVALCFSGLLTGTSAPAVAAAGEADVLGLFADLPQSFVIEQVEDGEPSRVFRVRSAEPIRRTADRSVYARATVTITRLVDAVAAAARVERMLATADPDTGLTYAWDFALSAGERVVHVSAGCTFAEESFLRVARALVRQVAGSGGGAPAALWCRCGGGCRSGAPVPLARWRADRLPPVRRDAGVEGDEFDNRLDPSGAWKSDIGELSLVHYADRLAFVYTAVFGPAARNCEAAGVAGLVGTDRYEHLDELGTVAFTISETEVRLELVEGVASFCGMGWRGDRFALDGFEPPAACRVAADDTHFHVVEVPEPEVTRDHVVRGSRVDAVRTPIIGDEEWSLARISDPGDSRLGLLPRRDLECPGAAATSSER